MGNLVDEPLISAFREVMAGVAAPVAVVTSTASAGPYGTTVSAFASLSVAPPMVLVALDQTSHLLSVIMESMTFGVNVLGAAQSELAVTFARKGADKLSAVLWGFDHHLPRLTGAPGWLACKVADLVEGGDHVVVLGTVIAAETTYGLPLTYHMRQFGTHTALEAS